MLRDTKNSHCLYIITSTAITYAMNLFKGITSKHLAASVSHDYLIKKLLNIHIYNLHAAVFKEKS